LVKIEHPLQSKPLHVHIIEHLCPVRDLYGNEFDEVSGHTIFVIFTDHILRIRLEDRKLGSSFEECETNFSFCISEPESSSFTIIEDDEHERLKACLVLAETNWKKVELFEVCLLHNDKYLFRKNNDCFFRLPPNITGIEISLEDGYIILTLNVKSTEFTIYIFNRQTIALDDDASPIFLLKDFEKCFLATSNQVDQFQGIEFEIVGTIYVCPFKDDNDTPEIQEFIRTMLEELNKYQKCRWDSDGGSDDD
jgi:hypothetical protein